MNLSLLAAYFAAILLLIATPGPVVAMVATPQRALAPGVRC